VTTGAAGAHLALGGGPSQPSSSSTQQQVSRERADLVTRKDEAYAIFEAIFWLGTRAKLGSTSTVLVVGGWLDRYMPVEERIAVEDAHGCLSYGLLFLKNPLGAACLL
jgi:hypothetical protein